jgi:WD40-like Beta Propeller Repeat
MSPKVLFALAAAAISLSLNAVAADPQFHPTIFAPGVISGPANDASPAFSPDGKTVYFSRGGGVLDGSWGGRVFKESGGNLWKVQKQGVGWGDPARLPEIINRSTAIFSPAVVADYSLYFMEATMTTKFRLYRSQYKNGAYQEPEPLPFSGGVFSDVDPVVSPDESFMVFPSTRPPVNGGGNHALFIVFRKAGRWGEPTLLEPGNASPSSDQIEARLSPDHRMLYFSSDRTMPIAFPRTQKEAERDQQRIQEWDNGLLNIWQVDLSPWLDPEGRIHGIRLRSISVSEP